MTTASPPASFLSTARGKLTLALLASVAFIDFVDASIVNVALPSIRRDLDFSVQNLQWVPSGYLLTYGGFMLLGGRAADLLGRRRVLVAGTALIGIASLIGGLAQSAGLLVGARFAQGIGAAMMLPAALSILTTEYKEGRERNTALGVWGAMGGLASAAGVLLGGLLTEGPGWRWVMFVNPIATVLVLVAIFRLIPDDRRRAQVANFDITGSLLATGGMLLLVFGLVKAPDQGWGATSTIAELAGAAALLIAFLANEARRRNPLLPLSIFRVKGLAAADVTQLIAFAGFLSMFFFLTLYMQNVLGWSPIQTGAAYLPLTVFVIIGAGISSQLMTRIGTRPLIVGGAVIAAAGEYMLSRIPVHGSYVSDLLPGMVIMALGLAPVFVAVTTAANAGVPRDKAGLAAALLNTAQQVGGALGLAVFSAVATSHTNHLLGTGDLPAHALTAGFSRALLASSLVLVVAAIAGLRTTNAHGEPAAEPESNDTPTDASVPALAGSGVK
jgi:EmrB/QacA subfamily drug resistance transporter